MTSIARPELSRDWWTAACPEAIERKHLESALTALERAERDGSDESLEASLASIAKAIERTRRDCDRRADADVLSALSGLAKQVKRRLEDLDGCADAEEEGESDSEDALIDAARVRKLMRALPKGPMPFAFGVGEGGATYLVLDRKRKGASLMSKLKDASGCSKATFGIASLEGKELCLDVHGPKLGSMRQRVREFLRENQPMPYSHVRVLGADDEDQDQPADDSGDPVEPIRKDDGPARREYPLGEDSEEDEDRRPRREHPLGEDSHKRKQPFQPPEPPAPEDDPPLNMVAPYGIAGSVGAGGKNHSDDVQAVQTALNRRGAGLEVDGKSGPKTIAAIRAFQKQMGFANPDGLVEKGGYTDRALAGETVELPKRPAYPKGPSYPKGNGGPRERTPHQMEEPYDPRGGEKIRPRQGYTVEETDPAEYARELARKVLESKKAADRRMEELKRAAAERAGEEAGRLVRKVEELYERGAQGAREVGEAVRDLTQRAFEADQETGRRVREDQVEALRKAAELAQRGFETASSGVEKGLRWLESQDGEE